MSATTTAPPRPSTTTIVYHGLRAYGVGARSESLTLPEHSVLQPFLNYPAMDEKTLIDKSGYNRAARILRGLLEKYGGMFAPFIDCPGQRGEGGFKVRIIDGRQEAKEKTAAHPERT